jgi:hypothetical protein
MPTPTPLTPAVRSRYERDDPAVQTNVIAASGGGRTATGDRRPAAKPAPALGPVPAPPVQPAKLGCSGYRIKHGTSDAEILRAIREHAAVSVAETEGSPWIAVSGLTDEQLLAVIGWSFIVETACSKVAEHLSGMAS